MAKLVNPLLSLEARGKANGCIYNTWRGIAYAKSFSSPSQPNTQAQLEARSRLVTQVNNWIDLSDAQRTAWSDYASEHLLSDWTGTPKRITGQNWYIRCNVQSARFGGSEITDPPTTAAPDGITGFAVTDATADMKAAWTTPTGASLKIEFREQGPHSEGAQGRYQRSAYLTNLAANASTPAVIHASATNGRYTIWARVVDPATGLTSQWVSDVVDMAA